MLESLDCTVSLMLSDDYKERFKAEYYQLSIRYNKIMNMLNNWDSLDFTPTCKKDIFRRQRNAMRAYLDILEERALIEKVDL